MGYKSVFAAALMVLLLIIPFSYADETLHCIIYNPSGINVKEDPVSYPCSGVKNRACSVVCSSADSACCNVEGQYTWQVSTTIDSNGWCGSGSEVPNNAHYVDWDTQAWCTQACTGKSVVWEPVVTLCCGDDAGDDPDWGPTSCQGCPLGLNQGSREWSIGGETITPCCGDDSGEYIRDCQDNNEGICIQASDNHACCDQGTDCVYDNVCYAWRGWAGEWECGAIELGVWHDVVPPQTDIKINDDEPYTITRDVLLKLSLSDGGSGLAEYLLENDDEYYELYNCSMGGCPLPEFTKDWTLSVGDGLKTVYFKVKDNAGNFENVSDTIILDTTDPIAWIDPPLTEWTGLESEYWAGSGDGSVKAFNVSWKAEDTSGIDRYQAQYNTSALPWTDWTVENPVARYNLDYIYGNQVLDGSGNDNDGTVYGAALAPGKFGQALSFGGDGDYVGIGQPESLKITGEVTLAGWIRAVNDGLAHTVISRGYAYMVNAPYSGNMVEFYGHDGTDSTGCAKGWEYDNQWIHLAAVIRPYSGSWTLKGYVNGEEVCTDTNPNFNGPRETGEIVDIGRLGGYGGRDFNGLIDEVRIYDRALSESEVKQLYYACDKKTECTFGPAEPVQVLDGETYSFRVRALDNVNRLGAWSPEDHTTPDTVRPELTLAVVDQDGNNILDGGVISHEDVKSVTIASSALDSISGIMDNYIYYCRVYAGVEDCWTEHCGPALPGGVSSCSVGLDYGENMVIKFRAVAEDYAGNHNASPGMNRYFFVTEHALVNFVAHRLEMIIGDGAFMKVQVRNMQDSFDNITVNVSGYEFAGFADTGDIGLGSEKRSAWVGLNPYEERELFVKVLSSSIGQHFIYLNATSTLTDKGDPCTGPDCVTDSDMAFITMGYLPEFPGLNIWGVLLLVAISLIVYSRVGIKGLNR